MLCVRREGRGQRELVVDDDDDDESEKGRTLISCGVMRMNCVWLAVLAVSIIIFMAMRRLTASMKTSCGWSEGGRARGVSLVEPQGDLVQGTREREEDAQTRRGSAQGSRRSPTR